MKPYIYNTLFLLDHICTFSTEILAALEMFLKTGYFTAF